MRLQNRVALVTGASRGIGRAIALALAKEGADVAVNYRQDAAAAAVVAQAIRDTGRRASTVRADTAKRNEVGAMVYNVVQEFGRIDVLVNNAGILKRTPLFDITDDEWDAILNTNLKGYFVCGQTVGQYMRDAGLAGTIINIASIRAVQAGAGLTHYSVAKAGVVMLTKQMALELAPYGIRVNAIAPGLIETDLNRKDIANPAFRDALLTRIPLGVVGRPEDVAGGAVFLASDDANLMTGATIFIDAGITV